MAYICVYKTSENNYRVKVKKGQAQNDVLLFIKKKKSRPQNALIPTFANLAIILVYLAIQLLYTFLLSLYFYFLPYTAKFLVDSSNSPNQLKFDTHIYIL